MCACACADSTVWGVLDAPRVMLRILRRQLHPNKGGNANSRHTARKPISNRIASSPLSIRKLQLGASSVSSSFALGVKSRNGATSLDVGMRETLTMAFGVGGEGIGVHA